MEVMERDPAYIAQQLKYLRKTFRFTQENLAEAAGLTARTIEKLESGRPRPEEQTLRSLARAFKLDVKYFEKPTPEEEARQRAEIARAARKTVLVPTDPNYHCHRPIFIPDLLWLLQTSQAKPLPELADHLWTTARRLWIFPTSRQ